MGVLDDAIREHLELKRQRGADPGEVEKQEAEALGPARREAPAAAFAEPEENAAAEAPTQLAEELVPPSAPLEPAPEGDDGEVFPEAPPEEAASTGPVEDPSAEELLAPVEDAPAFEESAEPDEVPAEEQIAPPTEAMPAPHPDAPPPAVPEEPEEAEPDEAPRKDDPLWFEQKSERDFDFDD